MPLKTYGYKFPFFDFPVCKIYLGTWARRVRRARGHVGHVGTLGTPFSRLGIPVLNLNELGKKSRTTNLLDNFMSNPKSNSYWLIVFEKKLSLVKAHSRDIHERLILS